MENLATNWKILIISIGQIINFAILFFLLKKFVFPRFFGILKERREKINQGLKDAEKVREELEKLRERAREMEKRSQKKGEKIIEQYESLAKKKTEEIIKQAQKEKEREIEKGREVLFRERAQQREQIRKEIINNALFLAEKILGEKMNEEKDKEIIRKYLYEGD